MSVELDKAKVSAYPLRASEGEPGWRCSACSIDGWSVERAAICFNCGAPSPVDEREMAERKAALRRHAGEKRQNWLGKRRIVSDNGRFHEDAPANGVYNIDAPEGDAARARELGGLQVQRNLMWEPRKFSAFDHLDSLVSMITLGQQGLADEELRQRVQPATVACV